MFIFPSHETHCLQALDVGCFRTWKKEQNDAIREAIRALDFEYSMSSFFRDLPKIRKATFKKSTIQHAFRNSGTWPINWKRACKKRRSYIGKRRRAQRQKALKEGNELPPLPSSHYEAIGTLNEMLDRPDIVGPASSPHPTRFRDTIVTVQQFLTHASILQSDLENLKNKVANNRKAKTTSRRAIHKGGGCTVSVARKKIRAKGQLQRKEAIKRVRREIRIAANVVKNAQYRQGVESRRINRERKREVLQRHKDDPTK